MSSSRIIKNCSVFGCLNNNSNSCNPNLSLFTIPTNKECNTTMLKRSRSNDSVHWYMSELTSSIVAKSGRPSDRYHLGKIIIESLRRFPDCINQIDGAKEESETNGSVLERSVQCAIGMTNFGLSQGDVIVIMAPNHLDVCIPFYAALYLGVITAAVDQHLAINELEHSFSITKPKLIFCQSAKATDVQRALNEIDLTAEIVTFDKGDYLCSFQEFMDKYGEGTNSEDFEPTDLDEDATAFFISTSGTTGLPKAAATTHKNFAVTIPYLWGYMRNFPTPTKMAMILSPLQWLTAIMTFITSPIFTYTRLQISAPPSVGLCVELLGKYRPTWTIFSPTFMTTLIKQQEIYNCDFSCLEFITLGGSAASKDLYDDIKQVTPDTEVFNVFGMSELSGIGFTMEEAPGSCGRPLGCWEYRLINTENGDDIYEADCPGELWIKGPGIFKEYHDNPEATEEAFGEDRWFRTGDMFYRDKHDFYYFVDRIKLLLKYKSYQISPIELETVIRTHPGVLDAAVTGISDAECGELPVACVVPKNGFTIDPEEIKQLIIDNLSDSKQLRGGVVILPELPLTATGKIHRKALKESVQEMERS